MWLWHFLLGFVKIRLSEGFRSTFIENCKGIDMWDIYACGNALDICVSQKEIKRIKSIAQKSGMKMKILKKCGLPFIFNKYKGRVGIPIGGVIFFALIFFLSGYVWEIKYDLKESDISQEVLSRSLSDLGLNVGSKIEDIDFYMLQNDCLLTVPQLNWIGISREGTRVTVRARDKVKTPVLYTEDTPCSVRAAEDGQLLTVLPYEGRTVKKIGDTVKKGEVIVSGISITSYGEIKTTHARADVTARTYYTKKLFVPKNTEERIKTGDEIKEKSLFFFGKTIKFSLNSRNYGEEYDIINSNSYVNLLGVTLPIGITEAVYEKCETVSFSRNENEMKIAAENMIKEMEEREFAGKTVTERKISADVTEEGYEITLRYECEEDIGYEEIILNEEYEKTAEELKAAQQQN